MKLHAYRRVITLATFMGLSSLAGCGDPCLDDGRGKGKCNAQDGSESADGTTNTSESAEAEAEATAETGTADAGGDCANDMQDPGETDVDCGGTCVDEQAGTGQCDTGQLCEMASDCISGFCDGGMCGEVDECLNGTQDASETDVDCGGACVADPGDPQNPDGKCDNGQLCEMDGDCVSNLCDMGTCSGGSDGCTNMMMDMGETDVDCGGDCVEDPNDPNNDNGKCLEGEACLVDSDCATELCADGMCAPNPCADMMQNNDETDVDCGGACVADPNDPNNDEGKCDDGQGCLVDSDCASESCIDGTCGPDPCADMMQNNDETDVDCGGACVLDPNDPLNPEGKCDNGQGCLIDGDCVSNVCDPDTNVCVDVCMNMMQDQAETDVDCGGACVVDPNDPDNPDGKCDDGQGCLVDSDCINDACDPDLNICLGICENGQLDPNEETDVDCGNMCVEVNPNDMDDIDGQCGEGETCVEDFDCVAGQCTNGACDVCAVVDGYSECATCLVTGCCGAVQACLADVPKCVCWFNCISEPGSTVQGCMDQCGNGNIGTIQSCVSNTCMQQCG
jgi:hypothetical protein